MALDVSGVSPVAAIFEKVVSARVVRRVIRRHRHVGGFGREVPHEHGYVLPAEALHPRDRKDFGAPETGLVVLVSSDADNARTRFELSIFAQWEALQQQGLLPESAIRERIHRVGQAEIDEVRAVLRTQRRLLPPLPGEPRDGVMWSLFAAYWAELRVYDRERLTHDLPTLAARHDEIDRLLAADVPWPMPVASPDTQTQPVTHEVALAARPTSKQLALGARLDVFIGGATSWALLLAAATEADGRRYRRLTHDLRKASLDAERPLERGDVLRFVLSFGRRPLVQPLPFLGPVRVIRHLARARKRAVYAPLTDAIDAAIDRHEQHLRTRLRPVLREALGPAAHVGNVVEAVSFDKMIDELIDRLVAKGRLDFPTIRDGVSRNHAKLGDVRPRDLVHDPLLAADRALATDLDGVHRRGEIYRRVLHRMSALAFGTPIGRALTRFALIPAIAAYAVIEALQHTIGLLVHLELMHPLTFIALALFVLGLVNFARVRHVTSVVLHAVGRGLHAVFIAFPRWLAARAFFKSTGWRIVAHWLLEPALIALPFSLPIWLWVDLPPPLHVTLALFPFVIAVVLVNSALGLRLEEATTDAIVRTRRFLTEDLLPGLFGWVLAVFRALLEGFERALYAVDERLRVRAGARRRHVVLLAFIAVPWRVISYIARLYVNLSLEPKVNPVKHFPAVTIGHKLVLPLSLGLRASLEPTLGSTAADTIATVVLFVVPGLFGFLAWELKENWRLYAKNRPKMLRPTVVGSHGETLRRLLRPGFHSGTLPKLFKKLRKAIRRKPGLGRARALASLAAKRHHLEQDLHDFIARDVLALAARADVHLAIQAIELASNRVRVRFDSDEVFTIEEQSGHIVGSFQPPPHEPAVQLLVAGLHRLAAVDFIRETIAAGVSNAAYDIDERGLVVWPCAASAAGGDTDYTTEVVRDLAAFTTPPILWSDWVAGCQRLAPAKVNDDDAP